MQDPRENTMDDREKVNSLGIDSDQSLIRIDDYGDLGSYRVLDPNNSRIRDENSGCCPMTLSCAMYRTIDQLGKKRCDDR